MNKYWKDNSPAIIFFSLMAILLLWQMLLPGYVLTLDMIFGPKIKFLFTPDGFFNNLPFRVLLNFFSLVIPVWVIQKIILILLFFLVGYLAYYFLPVPKKYYANFWAGLFYLANPFVYERFLAGQYLLLFAYALFPPLVYFLFAFFAKPNLKNSLWLVIILCLISVFSIHFLIIALLISIIYSLYHFLRQILSKNYKDFKKSLLHSLIIIVLLLIFISYWFIPYLLNYNHSVLNTFDQRHWQAFATSADSHLGTALNVLALYGFWGENQNWAKYFLWAKDSYWFWLIMLFLLWGLILIGFYRTQKDKSPGRFFWLLLAGLGFVFSCGVGRTWLLPINDWLFKNIWFWSGFRDSQKWSILLVLSFAYFGSFGVYGILDKIQKYQPKLINYFLAILFLIVGLYTYPIWGGFARQLKPVWYPADWSEVNKILNQDDSEFKVLFLPWHQYLSLKFNQNLITLNPALEYFDKPIIQGENIELGQIYSQGGDQLTNQVQDILLAAMPNQQSETIEKLSQLNIKYIIVAHDLDWLDSLANFYPVETGDLGKAWAGSDLTLYKIMLR